MVVMRSNVSSLYKRTTVIILEYAPVLGGLDSAQFKEYYE